MIAQKCYDAVANELREQDVNAGLWTRAFAESGGDEAKTKATYIHLRASQLHQQMRGTPTSGVTVSHSPFSHYGRLAYLVTGIAALMVGAATGAVIQSPATRQFLLFCGVLLFMVPTAYRLSDTGNSPWWTIVSLVPGFGLVLHIYLLFAPRGHNQAHRSVPPPIPQPTTV